MIFIHVVVLVKFLLAVEVALPEKAVPLALMVTDLLQKIALVLVAALHPLAQIFFHDNIKTISKLSTN